MKYLLVSLALLALLAAQSAEAGAILLEDSRGFGVFIQATGSDGVQDSDGDGAQATPFAPFNESRTVQVVAGDASGEAVSSQNSSVTTSLFSGTGSFGFSTFVAREDADVFIDAENGISILFSLSDPHTFDLSGLLSLDAALSPFDLATVTINLISGGNTLFDFFIQAGFPVSLPVTLSGALPPGKYSFGAFSFLLLQDDFSTSGRGEFDFDFRLHEVPEPTSLSLLLLGVCSVILSVARGGRFRVHSR